MTFTRNQGDRTKEDPLAVMRLRGAREGPSSNYPACLHCGGGHDRGMIKDTCEAPQEGGGRLATLEEHVTFQLPWMRGAAMRKGELGGYHV